LLVVAAVKAARHQAARAKIAIEPGTANQVQRKEALPDEPVATGPLV
jgi:hypothetical protein